MSDDRTTVATLATPVPPCPYAGLLLYAMRRMAAGGLDDAFAAHALFTGFGARFRRPLVLLRAFMAEAARVSAAKVAVAPCCCRRMTEAEGVLLAAVASALERPEVTHDALRRLLRVHNCLGLVTSAQAVAAAFADAGMPLAAPLMGDAPE